MVLDDQGEGHMLVVVVGTCRLKLEADLNIEGASNRGVDLNNEVDLSIGEGLNEASGVEEDPLGDTVEDTFEERISNNNDSSNSNSTLISPSHLLHNCSHCPNITNLLTVTTNQHLSLWRAIYLVLMKLSNLRRFNLPLLPSNKAYRLSLLHVLPYLSLWIRHAGICLASLNII
jgi:hypothetical protein